MWHASHVKIGLEIGIMKQFYVSVYDRKPRPFISVIPGKGAHLNTHTYI